MAEADIDIAAGRPLPAEAPLSPAVEEPAQPRNRKRIGLMLSLPLAIVIGGLYFWWSGLGEVSTENAYLQTDKVAVASEINGPISQVLVHENQQVKAGDLLFRIDPEPYRLAIREADAAIAQAQANVIALSNASDLSGASIAGAREDIAFAQARLARQQALWARGFTTKADYEASQHAVAQAREELRVAQADAAEASAKLANGAAVPGENPQVAAAKAQRASAELNLRRTEVRAPTSGRVAQADRLQVGQLAIPAMTMVTIVADKGTYVEANFKETQLDDMRPGQPAEVRFDAFSGLALKGHVLSIGAGTGSEFSLLPAQNATGNWVKVTQRVPVRIALDEKSPRLLIAGQSAEVTVFTDGRKR
ncbi:MAG TPA: HlyD family secretion protein [Novosphingobium sp.]|nr:HlyD family secretion protein [Novosphingobium sp.]